MAVPKRRMSRANTRSRRAQWKADKPELVNSDPYGAGWMLRIDGASEAGTELLDEAAYQNLIGG